MPNNIIITPGNASIQFSGSANNDTIRLQVEPSGSVAFYGNSGSLFSITDQLSGSLMSVNDISGLPILEVFSDNRVVMGTFNQNTLVVTGSRIGIDKAVPTADLDISGSVFITGSLRLSSGGITSSLFGTSSWANNSISSSFATNAVSASYFSGSISFPNGLIVTGGLQVTSISASSGIIGNLIGTSSWASNSVSSSFATTASFATTSSFALSSSRAVTSSTTSTVLGGTSRYVPMWTGSSGNELTSSIMYQTSKGIFIGYDTTAHFHSAEGETLAVHSGETGVKNVIYAHGTIDDDYRINLRNISSGSSASANFKATADIGNDIGGFVEFGINSSTYSRTDQIGGPLDAYLFTTGSDLLIGTLSPDKRIILFTGPGDADNNARVYIDASGSVGINTAEVIAGAPDALRVKAVPSVATFNVITALGLTDDYAQINMKNTGTGNSVSSDIVATANNGDENTNFVNMGINGETYTGTIGGPNDAYVYNTGGHLHLGVIDPGEEIMLFVGGEDVTATTKLTLRDNNQHVLSGSLDVTGSLNVLDGIINKLTASFAISASFAPTTLPSGVVSSSTQINTGSFTGSFTGTLIGTSSWATNAVTASYFTGSITFPSGLIVTGSILATTVSASSFIGPLTGTASFAVSSSRSITSSFATSASFATTSSYALVAQSVLGSITSASYALTASYTPPTFIDNLVTVGLLGSNTNFTSIKTAVDSITDASAANTYTVRVYPGVYIEDTITLKPYIAVKGDSSTSTIVSASNPNNTIFVMADQTMVIDMQIQGSTGTNASAIVYSSPTTPQTNAIAYAENIRFGTNYTNAKVVGSGSSGNCILQCSNVKYGGFTSGSKSFDVGFYVTSGSDGGIGRMQLRNVTSTNGGVAGTDDNQIFALADAPGCTFIVNGCLLTRATGAARGTGFKVYNGGQLRLTGVNFQRWTRGIWAPQTGSAPSIDAIALNFENCTTDVAIEHSGSIGKVQGTDTFLKTQINFSSSLYEVGKDARRIRVAKKGGDFTSISASVAYITDSSETNRYVIEVGPGQYTEKTIDLTGKPYVSIVGSNIQTTQIFASSSTQHIVKMGINNEISFLTLANAGSGYAAIYVDDVGDFAQAHKISIYDSDIGVQVVSRTQDTQFYGEYIDINGPFSYGTYVSASNNALCLVNMENYYLFPSASPSIGNYATHPSASLSMHSATFQGDNTTNSVAIQLESGAQIEGSGLDIQDWDYGIKIPNVGTGPNFRLVGTMIHGSSTYDIDNLNATTRGRFQGVSNHTLINNVSQDLYWNFLDDEDGENDVTRKLSVTFADGTHTDATTLIFKGSSMGVLEGGAIVTSSGLTVTAQSGYGYLHDPIDPEVFKRFDWTNGNITLTANSTNYLFINSSGVLTAASSTPNFAQNIILGRVVTNDTGVEFIDQSGWNAEHTANRLSKFTREALGPVFADGGIVSEDAVPFRLDVTAGNYYFAENNFLSSGTSSINLTQYYPSASTWARYTSSVVPNNTYASSSQLVPMSASAYTKHTVYLVGAGIDEKYFLVINSNQYATLVQAENATLPTIPTYFDDGVVPLAAVYVQSGSANITQIQDIRPIIGFRAAGVNASSVHGNLLGLNADDHPQYLLVNGTRAMAGNLSLGGNNITNIGTLIGTSSWANNATSSSFATTASFAPYTGLRTKAGNVANTSFTGNPKKATVTFTTAFPNTSYAVVVTGEDARSWTIESKLAGSFVINANSNTNLAGTTYWVATAYGET